MNWIIIFSLFTSTKPSSTIHNPQSYHALNINTFISPKSASQQCLDIKNCLTVFNIMYLFVYFLLTPPHQWQHCHKCWTVQIQRWFKHEAPRPFSKYSPCMSNQRLRLNVVLLYKCVAQKCQIASDSSPLRGRCSPSWRSKAWLCVPECVSSTCSGSAACSNLMPRHPWMTWPRIEIILSHYCDSPLACWSCVMVGRFCGSGMFSSYMTTFQPRCVLVPKKKIGKASVESPLWLWSRIKATGLLCYWKLHSSSPVDNTPD